MPRGRKPKAVNITPAEPKEKKKTESKSKNPTWCKYEFRRPGQIRIIEVEATSREEAESKLVPGEYEFIRVIGKETVVEEVEALISATEDADI